MAGVVVLPKAREIIDDRYRLTREIGRGGFGVVFEASDRQAQRLVAVKMLLPETVDADGVWARFDREARLASTLRHPNSVEIFAFGIYGGGPGVRGLPYIVMEYLNGEDLQDYLNRHRTLSVAETARILMQALGSLAEAHDLGIIHRDLKPENLFLCTDQDTVKVLDFGIAKAVSGSWGSETLRKLTAAGLVCGTPEFMSPEQAMGKGDLTPSADVYAVGCLAYQMLTGEPPFGGRTPLDIARKHITEPLPSLPAHVDDSFLGPILRRALAKEPSERYRDAGDLLGVLEAATHAAALDNVLSPAVVLDELPETHLGPEAPGYRGPTVMTPATEDHREPPGAAERRRDTAPSADAIAKTRGASDQLVIKAIALVMLFMLGFIAVVITIAWPWIAPVVIP